MPDITSLKVQREIKPKIEDVIPYLLDGEMKNVAIVFAARLRENKMAPRWSGVHNTWTANFKSKIICKIMLINDNWKEVSPYNKHSWVVIPYLNHLNEYDENIKNEGLQYVVWDNICFYCSTPCRSTIGDKRTCFPGRNPIILGKEFKRVCASRPLVHLWDPDETAINGIMRLLELEKQTRMNAD